MKITIISTGIKRFSENMLRTLHYNTNELLRTYTKLSSKMYKGNSKDNVSIRAECGGDVTFGELDILMLIDVHCHLNKLLFSSRNPRGVERSPPAKSVNPSHAFRTDPNSRQSEKEEKSNKKIQPTAKEKETKNVAVFREANEGIQIG